MVEKLLGPIYEHELELSSVYPTSNCPFESDEREEEESSNSDSTCHSEVEFKKFSKFLHKIEKLGKISKEERVTIV